MTGFDGTLEHHVVPGAPCGATDVPQDSATQLHRQCSQLHAVIQGATQDFAEK